MSSEAYPGDFGGVEGADLRCQALAESAGLGGRYLAWIASSPDDAPVSRFEHYRGEYKLVDGTTIAFGWDELASGMLERPIEVDETGTLHAGSRTNTCLDPGECAWTAVRPDGGFDPGTCFRDCNCLDWTDARSAGGGAGLVRSVNGAWTDYQQPQCNFSQHLYCIQNQRP